MIGSTELRKTGSNPLSLRAMLLILLWPLALASACERPPMSVEQKGFRGVAIQQVTNPRSAEILLRENQSPAPLPPVAAGSPPAGTVFKNLQVLGDVGSLEFTRLMASLTTWVSPQQGCNYCHVSDMSLDQPYTKVVARRMLQMTRAINTEWKDHVGDTGVTCYTCHRGQPVPAAYWVRQATPRRSFVGNKAGQNSPAPGVGLSSLPYDPFGEFLENARPIRVQSASALPMGNASNIKDAERTYGLMIHMSEGLGVNCTHCHNSRAFAPWEESMPPRETAWYGIRMVRDLNRDYMAPLADVFPANRKGPEGDPYKVNCATCHRGLAKPLMGASLLKDYPSLVR